MKVKNPAPGRPERIQRGLASTIRATGRGITVRDNGVDVEPVWDVLLGQGLRATDLDDGAVRIDATGGSGSSGNQGSAPILMLNNSGQDLNVGAVVVVDETADQAVTVTTTVADIRIAGVVQEPIADGAIGLVLFNGFAPVVNAPAAVRGEYAQTATTATEADSTAAREAGSFAVYLTGTDFGDFVSPVTGSRTTTLDVPDTTLAITMPPAIPANRVLFLALWLEAGTTDIDIPDWTLIGAESGFYYFYKVSVGDDDATATWTTASVAVASVLLLHEVVSLAIPLEDHDYDSTTSAATVGSLSDVARYAIAGVQADAAVGSGFVELAGGTAGFSSSGTPALVQSKGGLAQVSSSVTFDAAVTVGNVVVAVPFNSNTGDAYSTDPRQGGTCPPDSNMTQMVRNICTNTTPGHSDGNDALGIQAKVADDTYAGPYGTASGCASNNGYLQLLEFENIGVADYETLTIHGGTGTTIDCGDFTVAATDVVIMAIAWKSPASDPTVSVNGFTQIRDATLFGGTWGWVGYKIGNGDASVTTSSAPNGWVAAAIKLTQGTSSISGTLAGKYIGHASSATSPFTGAGAQDDAIFALNLLSDAKASALLYGPDLGGAGGFSGDAGDVNVADAGGYFAGTDVEAVLAELASKDIGYQAHGNMGSTETFSALVGWHSGTFNADCTFTFSGATSGLVASMVLELTEDGTGTWTPTWPGSVVWPGGVMATHDETAGTTTIYLFQSRDGGTTWYGFQAGAGGSSVDELDDLSDVTITAPAEDDDLRYNGSQWVNYARKWEWVTGGEDVLVWDGDDAVYDWSA